jgi:hypothetical protein
MSTCTVRHPRSTPKATEIDARRQRISSAWSPRKREQRARQAHVAIRSLWTMISAPPRADW